MSESSLRLLEIALSFLSHNWDHIFLTANFTAEAVSFVDCGTTFSSLWADQFRWLPSPNKSVKHNTRRRLELYCPWLQTFSVLCLASFPLLSNRHCIANQFLSCSHIKKEELKDVRQAIKQCTFYLGFPLEFYTLNTQGLLRPQDFHNISGWNWLNHVTESASCDPAESWQAGESQGIFQL